MNCEKYINAELIVCMESPVNKSFAEGMQDTPTIKPVKSWFGMPPQPVLNVADKGISRLHTDRDVCKGSTDTPRGATFRTGTTLKLKNGGSTKRSQTVRGEGVTGSKSRTSVASARRVCQMRLFSYPLFRNPTYHLLTCPHMIALSPLHSS
jgi:hypothetical protein